MAAFIPKFLRQLRDVVLSAPADGEVIAYDDASGKWVNSPAPGGTPDPHATSHEDGGTDEIDVTGLSGVLADAQTPAAHVHSGADITSGTVADARIASTIARDSEVTAAIAALSTVYQPLDSDLTSIAALATTAFGRGLLELANQAALLAAAGAAAASHAHAGEDITSGTVADARIASTIARDSEVTAAIAAHEAAGDPHPGYTTAAELAAYAQPLDSDLTAIAALSTTAFGRAFLALADEAAFKAAVNLEAGTDFPSQATFDDHSARHENGGADEISLAGLSGTSEALQAHLDDATDAHDASAISFTPNGSIAATDVQTAIQEVRDEAGAGGAPTDVDYLVGTASGGLSAEIVVGTTPGGELGGTWASPTVDATHSGSSHAAVQAAAEATAAAALAGHTGDTSDAHDASAISVDSTSLSGVATDVQASLEELDNLLDDHSARHENGGADEISIAGLSGTSEALQAHLDDATDAHDASAISIADAANDFTATDVEGALAELQADAEADATALSDHIADTSAAHAASAISADSTTLVGTGTDVQAVLEELDNGIADHLADSSAAHAASAISYNGGTGMSATDVEAAIDELANEKLDAATYTARTRRVQLLVSDPAGSAITTGDGKCPFLVTDDLNGLNLVGVAAAVTTVSSSGTPTIQIRNETQAADMLTTKLTIDASEKTSYTAAAAAVIDTGNDDVATGDILWVDIDVAGTGAKGLIVVLVFGP